MAAGGLLALLDDITALLDDVAVLGKNLDDVAILGKKTAMAAHKVAAKNIAVLETAAAKTLPVVGDDVAVTAETLQGMRPNRETPVIWAVFKGSVVNKAILSPLFVGLRTWWPKIMQPILMCGGAYLCYEGAEKILHGMAHKKEDKHPKPAALDPEITDVVAHEKEKIKSAIRTDFILSAEITAISLGSMAASPWPAQLLNLFTLGVGIAVGVYASVWGIVKADDAGLLLMRNQGDGIGAKMSRVLGRGLLGAAPKVMSALSYAGTAAMFMVGGEILMHGIPAIGGFVHEAAHGASLIPYVGSAIETGLPVVAGMMTGVVAGFVTMTVVNPAMKVYNFTKSKWSTNQDIKPVVQPTKPTPSAGLSLSRENTPDLSVAGSGIVTTVSPTSAMNKGAAKKESDHDDENVTMLPPATHPSPKDQHPQL